MIAHWQGKRVLVTGAGGFIGSHLTERLVALGATTRAFVHYRGDGGWGWLEHSTMKEDVEVVLGDITDRDSVLQAMQDMEVVFHLAALIAIPYSYQAPLSFLQTNAQGTLNVLQAARTRGVERVVHTSTSEVYGTARYVPIDEAHPLQAQSPYAASKIAADKLTEAFALSYGLPVVTVRPFNTYGPRQSARAIIPTIATQCLTDGKVRLGNLTPRRDLNYVDDTVEGFLRAATAPQAVGRTINLGFGRAVSIEELTKLIATLAGKPVQIEQDEERMRPAGSEVEQLVADNRLARELLEWEPSVPLEEGLQRTIEWIQGHLDVYRPGLYVV
ncbi:MAG: NAD-dependent dehydratase [Candidatus Omnitrophica bacterium CG11_big_fil_rev_8_21_14_0_20_63_9]|nr:MAG: NAD-dependent dehydratase [Candidatus Omnitrophica bacterium CG11_big_fil_rev_8_21_14_0_20_63_9]